MKPVPTTLPVADSPAAAPAPAPEAPGQARYGQTYYDSGSTYVVDDPLPPNDDGGVVKLGTAQLSDMDFIRLVTAENEAMTANPNYTTPNPPVAALAAAIAELQQQVTAVTNAKRQLSEVTNVKDVLRASVEGMFKTRATYVQLTSNGNTALILNAGFPVRSSPSPIGVLPPPLNLRVDLNGTIGKMIVNWDSVAKSRGYLLECAIAGQNPLVWKLIEVGGKPTLTLNGQTVGVTYIFRVAAMGGTGGRSDWSTEVSRTAA